MSIHRLAKAFDLSETSPSLKLAAIFMADKAAPTQRSLTVDLSEMASFCCCQPFTAAGLLEELEFIGFLNSFEIDGESINASFSDVVNPPKPQKRAQITNEMRGFIMDRDQCCIYCGCDDGPFHIDHIIPASRGGSDDASNLALACATCNISKRDKLISEWVGPKGVEINFDKAWAVLGGQS